MTIGLRSRAGGWALATFLISIIPTVPATPAEADAIERDVVPYRATGYRYLQVAHGGEAGFDDPGFDDTTWGEGDAAFGTPPDFCAVYTGVKTNWDPDTDMLVRRSFTVPAGATAVEIGLGVDDEAFVYVNGQDVSGHLVSPGCMPRDTFVFDVPTGAWDEGENLLAVRAIDQGGLNFFDIRVTVRFAITPTGVRTTNLEEIAGAASATHTAWMERRGGPFSVWTKTEGSPKQRVTRLGWSGATGGFSGMRLVHQEFDNVRSEIRFFNVSTGRRSNPPAGVNTVRWEYWPSVSGRYLLFGRQFPASGKRQVILYDLVAKQSRVLDQVPSGARFLQPGQVNGNYAVWGESAQGSCEVYRRDIAAGTTMRVPNPLGKCQFAPSVAADGTVLFGRSGFRCGALTKLTLWRPGTEALILVSIPRGSDIGDTYAMTQPDGSIRVLYDPGPCNGDQDIFQVVVPQGAIASGAAMRLPLEPCSGDGCLGQTRRPWAAPGASPAGNGS